MKHKSKQMSQSYTLGILLTVSGGFLDAYTYFSRGHVFANAQTGNIVLLGINIAQGDKSKALYYVFPIIAYALGVMFSDFIKSVLKTDKASFFHWRQLIIFFEIALCAAVSFVPAGKNDIVVNTIISFVCALQVETFRKINGNTVATTMCTGNLRSGTELLFAGVRTRDKRLVLRSVQYYGIILFFIIGAVIGTVLTKAYQTKAIYFVCVLLSLSFLLMFINYEKNEEKADKINNNS